MKPLLLLGSISLVMALLAMVLFRHGWKQARTQRVLERLGQRQEAPAASTYWSYVERMFLRAGLSVPKDKLALVVVVWLLAILLGASVGGWMLLLLALLVPPLVLRVVLSFRYRKRLRRIVQQLPAMLDQVMRSLQTGRTLGDGIIHAIEASPQPLQGALSRVPRDIRLGVDLAKSLDDVAELYEQEELRILALGVKVNQRHGGSAIELLASLIKVIQEREQIARQLRAMTGETRLTAVVLAALPVALAAYIMAVNPGYLMSLWTEASGQKMLITAFCMQVIGCVLMWRMLRSI